MRPETQKQIVKAYSMMFEDSEMTLDQYIETLQYLNGGGKREKKSKYVSFALKASDEQILQLFQEKQPVRIKDIAVRFNYTCTGSIRERLHRFVSEGKIKETKVHSKLSEFTLV